MATAEGLAVIKRIWKTWRNGLATLMVFHKERCKVLHLERNNAMFQESRLVEKTLWIPVDTKLNMCQHHALAIKQPNDG